MTENFIKELEDNALLQELELHVDLANGEKKKLTGVFTVNEEKVKRHGNECDEEPSNRLSGDEFFLFFHF